jgi:GAF domain-containing protein
VFDAASYAGIGQRSHVAVPVVVSGEPVAGLTFGTLRHERSWPDDLVCRMQLLGGVFASALAHRRTQVRIDRLLEFERLLADLSTSLVGSPAVDLDFQANAALRRVGTLLGVDCSTL